MWERAGKKYNSEMASANGEDRNVKVLNVTYTSLVNVPLEL
jgi:hypothetical protein